MPTRSSSRPQRIGNKKLYANVFSAAVTVMQMPKTISPCMDLALSHLLRNDRPERKGCYPLLIRFAQYATVSSDHTYAFYLLIIAISTKLS